MKNLSKTKKIILGIATFVVVIFSIDYIWHYIEYKKKIDRIEREHRQEMIELQELENMYSNGNAYEKQKAYQELRENALRNGLTVDE